MFLFYFSIALAICSSALYHFVAKSTPENTFSCVINRDGALSLRNASIENPADHFRDKLIRVRGRVTLKDNIPRIEVSDAKQIEIVIPQ